MRLPINNLNLEVLTPYLLTPLGAFPSLKKIKLWIFLTVIQKHN